MGYKKNNIPGFRAKLLLCRFQYCAVKFEELQIKSSVYPWVIPDRLCTEISQGIIAQIGIWIGQFEYSNTLCRG